MVGAGSRWRCSFGASCGFVYLAQTQSVLPGQRRCGAPMVQTGRGGDAARYVVETNTVIQTVEASPHTAVLPLHSFVALFSSCPLCSSSTLLDFGQAGFKDGPDSLSLSLSLSNVFLSSASPLSFITFCSPFTSVKTAKMQQIYFRYVYYKINVSAWFRRRTRCHIYKATFVWHFKV